MIFYELKDKLSFGLLQFDIELITFDMVAFPAIRMAAARLLGNEIVSVQPSPPAAPLGLLFYLDFHYGNADFNTPEQSGIIFYPIQIQWNSSKLQVN